jgi:hypothetical protein
MKKKKNKFKWGDSNFWFEINNNCKGIYLIVWFVEKNQKKKK